MPIFRSKFFKPYPRAAGGPSAVPSRIPLGPNKNAAENKGILQDPRWLPGLAAVLAWGGPEPAMFAPETFEKQWKIVLLLYTPNGRRGPQLPTWTGSGAATPSAARHAIQKILEMLREINGFPPLSEWYTPVDGIVARPTYRPKRHAIWSVQNVGLYLIPTSM